MAKWNGITDTDIATHAYERGQWMQKKPYPCYEGIDNTFEMYDSNELRKFKPADFYDDSLMRELDQSGFVSIHFIRIIINSVIVVLFNVNSIITLIALVKVSLINDSVACDSQQVTWLSSILCELGQRFDQTDKLAEDRGSKENGRTIPSRFIFERNVLGGMPSIAAAPLVPAIVHFVCSSTPTMWARSTAKRSTASPSAAFRARLMQTCN